MDDWNKLREILGQPVLASGGQGPTGIFRAYDWKQALNAFPKNEKCKAGARPVKLEVKFDWVVTAQQTRRYKPNPRGFELMFERVGLPPARILHVAQSLYHDHVPAQRLGLRTMWVNRRAAHTQEGGATPPAPVPVTPDGEVPTLAALADLHRNEPAA